LPPEKDALKPVIMAIACDGLREKVSVVEDVLGPVPDKGPKVICPLCISIKLFFN